MTVGIHSMPFPASGQASSPEVLHVQTPSSTADDEARRLAIAIGRGDEAAFRELYDRFHERLFRFSVVLGHGDAMLADETVQSVFVTAAASLRRVEGEEHLWNWLARIARQQLGKALRRRRQDSSVVGVANVLDRAVPDEPDTVLEEKLDSALLAMEPEERQLIEWFYFDDLSHKEIAERLSATPKAVSSRLERARVRLRSLLARTLSHET